MSHEWFTDATALADLRVVALLVKSLLKQKLSTTLSAEHLIEPDEANVSK